MTAQPKPSAADDAPPKPAPAPDSYDFEPFNGPGGAPPPMPEPRTDEKEAK